MKRNLDLLRKLLLHIEEHDKGNYDWITDWGKLDKVDNWLLADHVKMLFEAGFIEMVDASNQNGIKYYPKRITMDGHDYLDLVRDPKVWRDTKTALKKVGGTASLAIIQTLAATITKRILEIST